MLRFRYIAIAICIGAALAFEISSAIAATIIADSVNEFSGTQGQDNWFYGYYDGAFAPSNFQEMTVFTGSDWAVDPTPPSPFFWTSLSAEGGHPNGIITTEDRDPVEQWAARRYISEFSGEIALGGNIADLDPAGGNGIAGHIFVDGIEVFSTVIENGNSIGVDYSLAATVGIGTIIDFAIAPRAANDLSDSSRFTATIAAVSDFSSVPEPSSLFALLVAGVTGVGLKWHRCKQITNKALDDIECDR